MYVISWRETAAIFHALCGESMPLTVALSECLPLLNSFRIRGGRKNTEMETPYLTDTLTDRLKWNPIWGIEEWIADTVTLLDYPMRFQTGSRARYEDKRGCKFCKIGIGVKLWKRKGREGNVGCQKVKYWNEVSHFGPWCWHNSCNCAILWKL